MNWGLHILSMGTGLNLKYESPIPNPHFTSSPKSNPHFIYFFLIN